MEIKAIVNLFLFELALIQAQNTYKGYKIYAVIPKTDVEKSFLVKMSKSGLYDFFILPRMLNISSEVMVEPNYQNEFENDLKEMHLNYSVTNPFDATNLLRYKRSLASVLAAESRIFKNYYRYGEINAKLEEVAKNNPNLTELKTIGYSFEKRPIKVLVIGDGVHKKDKKVIFVDAGIHAREWIAPAAAMYIIHKLVDNYTENEHLLKDYNWIVLPLANPDGYEYSHTSERYWRKTMKPVTKRCIGTDVNRNFNSHWEENNSTRKPCTETYGGETAFSEPETQAIRDVMHRYQGSIKMYINLHAYGGYLLYPYGWSKSLPPNWEKVAEVAKTGAEAIANKTGSMYKIGTPAELLYTEGGNSIDYGSEKAHIPVNIAMEIDTNGYGFQPPRHMIHSIAEATWVGVRAMAKRVIAG